MSTSFRLAAALALSLASGSSLAASDVPAGWGVVSGPLISAAGETDPTLTVCAQKIGARDTHCTTRHIRSKTGPRYSLAVPPGDYHVYAMTPDCPNWRAYYTAFVTCGSHVKCPSHARIPVSVRPGSSRNDVSPGDWYDVPESKKNACDP